MQSRSFLERVGHAFVVAGAWPGRAAAWLLLPMVGFVLAAIVGSLLKVGQIAAWQTDVPLFGTQLNLNGLAELQWHLLAIIVMLGMSYALARDHHVRVDLLYGSFGARGKAAIDLVGDLLFLLPFCAVIGWLSLSFVEFSYSTGEQSDYGGLTDRYLVKTFLPIGFVFLGIVCIGRILMNIGRILSPNEVKHG
ncbi:TRAP-type mannitol/chloroaromatic compound transport system, small permease component [Jannaschia seosinensis]|uniref:TRAP transporter small permease protein n=1 Tax=Jannaschia seosinensis TaxID=313367 RepID=A0A0M7B970_9RHOB|nr:TRAP transporter small permease subunit [Jannaschia seosinensis]CUH34640.1 TRAP-type mannitol/chloroaromatic compound transport system, small permease component [Jannaschia seosinensis]